MRLLNYEIVDSVSKKVLTFSALLRFGFDSEFAFAALLIYEISRGQACFVITEVHWMRVTVFSLMGNLIVHGYQGLLILDTDFDTELS